MCPLLQRASGHIRNMPSAKSDFKGTAMERSGAVAKHRVLLRHAHTVSDFQSSLVKQRESPGRLIMTDIRKVCRPGKGSARGRLENRETLTGVDDQGSLLQRGCLRTLER